MSALDRPAAGAALWRRQVLGVIRLELRRTFRSARILPVLLLASLPILVSGARLVAMQFSTEAPDLGEATTAWAVIYQTFVLRFVIFFSCVGVFGNLVRGEVIDKTLHHAFLAPVRRDVFLAGKYVAGLLVTVPLLCASAIVSILLIDAASGTSAAADYLLHGPGLRQTLGYAGVTALACIGYGGLFTALGVFLRNPVVAAVGVLGWESINFLLPVVLKKISIIHYLQSLSPVAIPEGAFAIIATPASPWIAIPGMLLLTVVLLWAAAWRIRRMEIAYTSD
jgi:ABC-type transport system involved in multi-copper enzyme maturation permease subunit